MQTADEINSLLDAHALHVWQHVNQEYYANLLSAVSDEASRFGYAFESGSSYIEVPTPVLSALARRLVDAKLTALSPGIPADDREMEIDRRMTDREGQSWLSSILNALALRGITLQRVGPISAGRDAPESSRGSSSSQPGNSWETARASGKLTGGICKPSHALPRSNTGDDGPELATTLMMIFFLLPVTGYFSLSALFRVNPAFVLPELLYLRNFFCVAAIASGLYLGVTFLVWAVGRLTDAINTLTDTINSRLE